MTITTMKCPECGEKAVGTVDTIPMCVAYFHELRTTKKGTKVDYDGETLVNWEGQQVNVRQVDGQEQAQVTCSKGHTWFSPWSE